MKPSDWPEDFAHENGNYFCTCIGCKVTFTGHKRRVLCKVCHVQRGISVAEDFQRRVEQWCLVCFGPEMTMDRNERNHRFLEESLELVQSLGYTKDQAHGMVDYVFSRPKGEPSQELGGVVVTLNALATAFPMPVGYCGEKELTRVWDRIDEIRAKQRAKPRS